MAEKFVEMKKDGEENIFVHPSVVDDHKKLHWQVVEESAPAGQTESAASAGDEQSASDKKAAKKAAKE
jgi:hypothetical protein